jgi:acyl-CoA synthetase (AMP-forming)/AMP-acid ligase II
MCGEENISTGVQTEDPRNLPEMLAEHVAAMPDKLFLFSEADERRYTRAEFAQAVNRARWLLARHGIKKGDVVSLLMPNSVEYVIAYFACFTLGALANPINSLLKSSEMKYVLNDSEAKAVFVNSEFKPQIERVGDELPHLRAVIEFDNERHATESTSGADEESPLAEIERMMRRYSSTLPARLGDPKAAC